MSPPPRPDLGHLLTEVQQAYPAFQLQAPPRYTLKTCILPGVYAGNEVVAKVLFHRDPVWRWYFDREVRLYQHFAQSSPPVRVPSFIAADLPRGILLLERVPGRALSVRRLGMQPLPPQTVDAVLDGLERLNAWPIDDAAGEQPARQIVRTLRHRLLEDPTAPLGWVRAGIGRCQKLGLLSGDNVARMEGALVLSPAVAFGHGDLLLRNVLVAKDAVALVDWECAGSYLLDWDRSLLWAIAPDGARALVAQRVQRADPSGRRWAAFLALVLFALARELHFCRPGQAQGSSRPTEARVRASLAQAELLLREAMVQART